MRQKKRRGSRNLGCQRKRSVVDKRLFGERLILADFLPVFGLQRFHVGRVVNGRLKFANLRRKVLVLFAFRRQRPLDGFNVFALGQFGNVKNVFAVLFPGDVFVLQFVRKRVILRLVDFELQCHCLNLPCLTQYQRTLCLVLCQGQRGGTFITLRRLTVKGIVDEVGGLALCPHIEPKVGRRGGAIDRHD